MCCFWSFWQLLIRVLIFYTLITTFVVFWLDHTLRLSPHLARRGCVVKILKAWFVKLVLTVFSQFDMNPVFFLTTFGCTLLTHSENLSGHCSVLFLNYSTVSSCMNSVCMFEGNWDKSIFFFYCVACLERMFGWLLMNI